MLHHGVKGGEKYPEKVRHFCLGLIVFSTRAYEFVRGTFHNHLPSVRTIRSWFANSDICGEPGIQEKCVERLTKIAKEFKEKNKRDLLCSLVYDEMHLRQQILFSLQNMDYVGYATYGQKPDNKEKAMAKQAIVFLLNGIDVNFEFPVAYYFIHELDTNGRKNLLVEIISMVTRCGIKIINLTFDGHSANMPAMESLGARLKIKVKTESRKLRPYINNPINKERIYVFLDPCHMEKLIRCRWATCEVFYDGNGEKIEWRYIQALYEYSCRNDFRTHKLTKKHMQWQRNAMNVRLAVETFSEAVASSLEYLREQGIPEFQGAQATIDFIRRMNTLFDIFNSRNCSSSNIFKRRMSKENKRIIFDFFEETIKFFKELKTDVHFYEKAKKKQKNDDEKEKKAKKERVIVRTENLPILDTRHRVGFLGFIIDMESLMKIFVTYVEKKAVITSIPTYNLLQDVIEMFFGRIRSCGGHNNNPNVLQFKGAYRKVQCNMRMDLSPNSNCRMFDMFLPDDVSYSDIYFVSSKRAEAVMDEKLYNDQKQSILEAIQPTDDDEAEPIENSGDADDVDTVFANRHILEASSIFMNAYIASQIEKKIMNTKNFYCNGCRSVFDENEKIQSTDTKFLNWIPCASTTEICIHAEKFFKLYDFGSSKPKYNFKVLYCMIFRSMDFRTLFPNSKFECDAAHKYQFIKCIVGQYINTRANQVSRQITLERQEKLMRQQCNRLVNIKGL